MRRLAGAGLIAAAGLAAQAAPATAAAGCSYEPDTDIARVSLQRRDAVNIGRSADGNLTGAGCAADATVETVGSVAVEVAPPGTDDDEQVTIDLTNGAFLNPNLPAGNQDIGFSVDLGGRGVDSLIIEGGADPDSFTVTGTSAELQVNGAVNVTATGVERVEIRGNDGNDEIDATTSTFGTSQPTALSTSTAVPGLTLVGGDGDDDLTGGEGDDMLAGNRGDDMLAGTGGDDWLDTGPGAGTRADLTVDGGDGNDTADFSGMFVPVEANLGEGAAAYADGGSGLDAVENVVGTTFTDLLVGDDSANVIDCGGGDDEAHGMGGRDRVRGNSGDDLLDGTGGGDSLDGGDGDDTLHGGSSGDGINGGSGADTIHGGGSGGSLRDAIQGGAGSDVIYGGNGRQVILAGDGLDEVYGEGGNDVVDGQDGEDSVFGGAGNDMARGGDGPDQTYGGPGNDHVLGGDGDDEVYGGSGIDLVRGGAGDNAVFGAN